MAGIQVTHTQPARELVGLTLDEKIDTIMLTAQLGI